jgi:mycofactocin biosynthetic radical S-adenosylmethionine protein MftC
MTVKTAPTPPERKPEVVGWEITSQCNLKCAHCFTAASTRPHDELTTAECRRVIDSLQALGVEMIGWTGGEPLLRQDLEELSAYAWGKGLCSTITTNGVLMTEERAARLIGAGNRTIQISLDGSTAARNHLLRGTTDAEYDAVVNAIRICKKLGARVVMASLVGRENLDDVTALLDLARREGVDTIRFCGFTPVGRGKHQKVQERLLIADGMKKLFEVVQKAQDDVSLLTEFDVGFGPTPPVFGFHDCAAGARTFYLKGNGDVYPCTALCFPQFLVGNVRERSLEELWNLPAMTTASEFPRDQIHGPCRECDNFAACKGACRGATLALTGDLTASFPHCLYHEAR